MSSDETRTLPDGRKVIVTELADEPAPGLTIHLARFFGEADGCQAHGNTPDEAVTNLLLMEHQRKMRALQQGRAVAGIGSDHGDTDLPPGYRSYVHHIDGNPYNNDPDNPRIVEGNERLFTAEMLERAADPSLPEGVIRIEDNNGQWWRYPLREFEEDA